MVSSPLSETANQIIKERLLAFIKAKILESILSSSFGFIGSTIGGFIAGKIAMVLISNAELAVYFISKDIATHAEAVGYNKTVDELESAKESGNEERISKAEQDEMDAFKKLVRFGNGSKKP